jgi:hypothetical protein
MILVRPHPTSHTSAAVTCTRASKASCKRYFSGCGLALRARGRHKAIWEACLHSMHGRYAYTLLDQVISSSTTEVSQGHFSCRVAAMYV